MKRISMHRQSLWISLWESLGKTRAGSGITGFAPVPKLSPVRCCTTNGPAAAVVKEKPQRWAGRAVNNSISKVIQLPPIGVESLVDKVRIPDADPYGSRRCDD
jgi:hypothetical protein